MHNKKEIIDAMRELRSKMIFYCDRVRQTDWGCDICPFAEEIICPMTNMITQTTYAINDIKKKELTEAESNFFVGLIEVIKKFKAKLSEKFPEPFPGQITLRVNKRMLQMINKSFGIDYRQPLIDNVRIEYNFKYWYWDEENRLPCGHLIWRKPDYINNDIQPVLGFGFVVDEDGEIVSAKDFLSQTDNTCYNKTNYKMLDGEWKTVYGNDTNNSL